MLKENEHIIKTVAGLLPASRRWLEQKGYITQDSDAIQLTPAGYEYFIKIWKPEGVKP